MPKPTKEVSPTKRTRDSEDSTNEAGKPKKKLKQDSEPTDCSTVVQSSSPPSGGSPSPSAHTIAERKEQRRRQIQKDRRRKRREEARARQPRELESKTRPEETSQALDKFPNTTPIGASSGGKPDTLALSGEGKGEDESVWKLSTTGRGRVLDKDPIFAGDEK